MTNEKLTLQEHMEMLGMVADHLAFVAKVPPEVIQRALAGLAISQPHAEQICSILNREHRLVGKVGFAPEHIKGMVIYQPPAVHTQPAFKPDF